MKCQFPDASQDVLSKDSRLRLALLTLFQVGKKKQLNAIQCLCVITFACHFLYIAFHLISMKSRWGTMPEELARRGEDVTRSSLCPSPSLS